MPVYKNSDMRRVIDEYIHHPKHREVLRLRFCESLTYEEIACAVNYSPQHVKSICRSNKALLLSQL